MNGLSGSDMSFVLFSSALVMLMVPGLALFYGGMVKSKNVLSTTMHSYAALVLISLQWIFIGYSIAFGPDLGGLIGNLDWAFLKGVGMEANANYSSTIPHLLFATFQMMFAIITAAVISGSFAERIKFSTFIIFMLLWSTFVYDPLAHWVWGNGGWLKNLGVLDFAGGYVVEINSGVSGLVAAIIIGKRKKTKPSPHHIPMAVLGGGLLWFGWFGFNAGSALGVNGITVNAFLTTNSAAAAGGVAWLLCDLIITKKPTVLGMVTGTVAGLVSITQGAGFVSPLSAIIIGLVGGTVSFFAIAKLKAKLGYDDTLDAFGCHGVCGLWGAAATGIFTSKAINPAGADGLLYGNVNVFLVHIGAALAVAAFAAIGTFVILKVMKLFMSLRAEEHHEASGLDVALHGEEAYNGIAL